jgi:predicted nuclease with TOPRIM domain
MRDLPRRTLLTYSQLESRVRELETKLGQAFSAEEMDILREQLSERATEAVEQQEALEWKVRMELARVREAERKCLAATMELRRTASALAVILGDEAPVELRPVAVRRQMVS